MGRYANEPLVVEPDWAASSYCKPEDLADYDFAGNSGDQHTIKMAATRTTLYDFHTGKVIATVAEGYEFYWGHYHPHVRQEKN